MPAIPDESEYERVDSDVEEEEAAPVGPVPAPSDLGRQEQRMIRLMENSDTDSSEPMILLDPSAPGYEQVREQSYVAQELLENEQRAIIQQRIRVRPAR